MDDDDAEPVDRLETLLLWLQEEKHYVIAAYILELESKLEAGTI